MSNFEKDLQDLTHLRKTNNSLRLQIDRLHIENESLQKLNHEINLRLDFQTQKLAELSSTNTRLQQTLRQSSVLYQQQIQDLKLVVQDKCRSLERLIPTLNGHDLQHDMLRIKILNELQLPHREQLLSKDQEIQRLHTRNSELESMLSAEKTKNEELVANFREQSRKLVKNHAQQMERFVKGGTGGVQRVQQMELHIRKLKRELQDTKLRASLAQKQSFSVSSKQNQRSSGNFVPQETKQVQAMTRLETQNQQLRRKLQSQDEDRLRLNQKIKSYELRVEENQSALGKVTIELRSKEEQLLINQAQKQNIGTHLEESQASCRQLRRQLQTVKDANRSLEYRLRILEEQVVESKREATKLKSQAIRLSSNQKDISQLIVQRKTQKMVDPGTSTLEALSQQNQALRNKLTGKFYQCDDPETLKQLQKVRQQLRLKHREGSQSRSPEKLRLKLRQANQKIVQLLQDKIRNARTYSVTVHKQRTVSPYECFP